jgi:hypothetical protein
MRSASSGAVDDHHRDQGPFGFDGGAGAALAHQHVHGAVVLAVGDHGFHHAVFLDAGDEISGQGGVLADVDIDGQGGRVEHFERGCCVHGVAPFLPKGLVGGAAQVTGQRPLSPRCFLAAGEACGAVADGGLSTRRARGGKFRRKSATKERRRDISGTAGPDEGGARRAGADTYNPSGQQPKNVVDKTGPGGPELCDGGPGPNSRPRQRTPFQLVGAQRKPGRALRACRPAPRPGQPNATLPAPACRRRPPPGTWLLRDGGPPPANHQRKPATTADRPR